MSLLFQMDDKSLGDLLSEARLLQIEADALDEQIKELKVQKSAKILLIKKRVNEAIDLSKRSNIVS